MYTTLITSLLIFSAQSNLICNGDIEDIPLNASRDYPDIYYANIPSDMNCWMSDSSVWVQEYRRLNTSQTLILRNQYCQTLQLTPHTRYTLQFDAFCTENLSDMVISIIINELTVQTYPLNSKNKAETVGYAFEATQAQNQICFSETHSCSPCNWWDAGLIDNISLIQFPPDSESSQVPVEEVPVEEVSVHFLVQCQQQQSILTLSSNLTYSAQLTNYLNSSLQLQIDQQIQTQFWLKTDHNKKIIVFVRLQHSYDLSTLQIRIPKQQITDRHRVFHVSTQKVSTYFSPLSQQQKNVLLTVKPVIEEIADFAKKTITIMRGFVCTYFILGLLNFWNVSLMYYFLMIKTEPIFVRSIFRDILTFFYQNVGILSWLPQLMQFQSDFILFRAQEGVEQKMDQHRSGYEWFKSYSFSSKILTNNLDNFIGFVLLIVRIGLLRLIIMIMPARVQKRVREDCNFLMVLAKEILGMAPFLFISSFTAILSYSLNFHEQFQKMGHILIVLTVFLCYVNLLIPFQKTGKSSRLNFQEYNRKYCEFYELLLGVSTPLLLIIGSPLLLLSINGLVLVFTLIDFFKRFKAIGNYEKNFVAIRIMIWFVFHGSYLVLYVLQKYAEPQSQMANKCGLTVIICLIMGGVVQFVKFVIQLVIVFYRFFRKVCRRKIKNTKNSGESLDNNKDERMLRNGKSAKNRNPEIQKRTKRESAARKNQRNSNLKQNIIKGLRKIMPKRARTLNQPIKHNPQNSKKNNTKCLKVIFKDTPEKQEVLSAMEEISLRVDPKGR